MLLFTGVNTLVKNVKKEKAEQLKEITYQIYSVDGKNAGTLITFNNENGIETIKYKNYEEEETIINCYGKTQIAIDYEMEDLKSYQFTVNYKNNEEKVLNIDFEIARIHGLYTLKNGIYVNEPDISTGFIDKNTRYMYLNNNGNLVPGNWLVGEPPKDWFDYANKKWANIYVENEGVDSYYVWIPRYCYRIDEENSVSGNERMDIKFINVYNEYIDGKTGEKMSWEDLEKAGYQIPEAFSWNSQFDEHSMGITLSHIIPGYWMSKYQLGEVEKYIIDYSAIPTISTIEVTNIKTNTSKTVSEYIYAIDGIEVARKSSSGTTNYTFENVSPENKFVNVTALDSNGEIVGSMTRILEISEPNAPDLSSFNPDTTFYVYWDENGNEHSETPISMQAPSEWYNYATANWANIVTRNNGTETYFVWIPRYAYKLNNINERSAVKFLKGTSSDIDEDYQIPEAFWWDNNGNGEKDKGEQLTGYWMSKYQLGNN